MLARTLTTTLFIALLSTGCTRTVYVSEDEEDREEDDAGSPGGFAGAAGDEGGEEGGAQGGGDEGGEDSGDAPDPSGNASLELVNSSSYTIYEVYVSPCTASDWGSDQTNGTTIYTGDVFTLSEIPPGCYDLLALGSEVFWETYGTELDGTFTWTLQD